MASLSKKLETIKARMAYLETRGEGTEDENAEYESLAEEVGEIEAQIFQDRCDTKSWNESNMV